MRLLCVIHVFVKRLTQILRFGSQKLAKWMRPKQRRYHDENTAHIPMYMYLPMYLSMYPPTLPTSLPTPTYHPRNLELRNCLKVRWQESAMDWLTTRHWGHSRDVACSGHCSFAALTNFSFCLTARNRIWLEWGLQPMRQQVHTLGAALDWLVDLIFIPKKTLGRKYYER